MALNLDATMNELRILILEDRASDADLLERQLHAAQVNFTSRHAQTRESFEQALAEFGPEVILADYAVPGFDGLAALELARMRCPDVPYIVVSGTLGEERAVEVIKSGATDFVLKDRLERVVPAVQRALADLKERHGRKQAEDNLRRRTEELERFNRLAVGRELRIVELKREVNALSKLLGRPEPYALGFVEDRTDSDQ